MVSYLLFVTTIAGIYALISLGLVTIWGQGGMVNLGLVGFYALGAYGSALVSRAGAPIAISWLTGAIIAGVVGLVLTLTTRKMRGDYLAIVSLGFSEVIRLVANNETWLTHGSDGISGIASPFGSASGVESQWAYLVLVWLVVGVAALLLTRLFRSPFGRSMRTVRDDPVVAAAAGKPVQTLRFKTFFLGAALTGLAGALYAHLTGYISPDGFVPLLTIYMFLGVTLGGHTRVKGAVVGAITVMFLIEGTRFVAEVVPGISAVQATAVRDFLIAAMLILVMQWKPDGVLGDWHHRLKASK